MKSKFLNIFIFIFLVFSLVGCAGEMGPQGPQGEQGIQGVQGEQGQPGKDGVNGKDGTSLLTGNGEPTNVIGIVGDSYIDLDTWSFYIKTTNGWIISGNIKGEKGDSAAADHNGTEGLEFYPINDTECAVGIGSAIYAKEIVIPSTYKQYKVTTIADSINGFAGAKNIEKVFLPDTITTIEYLAFASCEKLNYINIPKSVKNVDSESFEGSENIKVFCEVEKQQETWEGDWENGPVYWGITDDDIFTTIDGISYLIKDGEATLVQFSKENITIIPEKITLDNKIYEVKKIGKYSFYDCDQIVDLIIPNSIEKIDNFAFYSCDNLKNVFIPENVNEINNHAFYFSNNNVRIYCQAEFQPENWNENWYYLNYSSLESITWGIGEFNIVEKDEVKYLIVDDNASVFEVNEDFTEIIIPTSITIDNISYPVTSIEPLAFIKNTSLTNIVIPNTIKNIGVKAFVSNTNLKITISLSKELQEQTKNFYSLFNDNYSYNKVRLKDLIIVDCTEIKDKYFEDVYVENISFDKDIKSIGESAFYYSRIYSVYYNGSIEDWLRLEFITYASNPLYCSNNTHNDNFLYVLEDEGEVSYNEKNYELVTDVNIPSNIAKVNSFIFDNYKNLKSVIISNGVTEIKESAFYGCEKLESIIIPNSVITIEKQAFAYCDNVNIYCESYSKLDGWVENWNLTDYQEATTYYGGTWEYDSNGNPVPLN